MLRRHLLYPSELRSRNLPPLRRRKGGQFFPRYTAAPGSHGRIISGGGRTESCLGTNSTAPSAPPDLNRSLQRVIPTTGVARAARAKRPKSSFPGFELVAKGTCVNPLSTGVTRGTRASRTRITMATSITTTTVLRRPLPQRLPMHLRSLTILMIKLGF